MFSLRDFSISLHDFSLGSGPARAPCTKFSYKMKELTLITDMVERAREGLTCSIGRSSVTLNSREREKETTQAFQQSPPIYWMIDFYFFFCASLAASFHSSSLNWNRVRRFRCANPSGLFSEIFHNMKCFSAPIFKITRQKKKLRKNFH